MKKLDQLAPRILGTGTYASSQTLVEMWQTRSHQGLFERVGKTAFAAIMGQEMVRDAVRRVFAHRFGYSEVLGAGFQQLVLADGDQVTKVLLGTLALNNEATYKQAEIIENQNQQCAEHLGFNWLATKFEAIELNRGNQTVVVARQKRLRDPSFYLRANDIPPSDETRDLASRIAGLHVDTGLYPDLCGLNNLANADGRLTLIDTIPVTPEDQHRVDGFSKIEVGEFTAGVLAQWSEAA